MSPLARIQDAALRRLEKDMGYPTMLFRGVNVPCVPQSLRRDESLSEVGPPIESLSRKVTVRKSAVKVFTVDSVVLWTSDQDKPDPLADNDMIPPNTGKAVILEQRNYVMGPIEEDGAGAAWVATLVSEN